MAAIQVGDTIRLIPAETEQYPPADQGLDMTVTHVARSKAQHPGYDEALRDAGPGGSPIALVDATRPDGTDLDYSLYEWEFEIVGRA